MKKKLPTIHFSKPTISKKDLTSVLECLIEENISHGNLVKELTNHFNEIYTPAKTLVTASVEIALYLILKQINLKEGEEVLLSPLSDIFILKMLQYFKAKMVFYDTKKDSFDADQEDLLNKITPSTKVVIINHHLGIPSNIPDELVNNPDFFLLEDITSGLGSKQNNEPIGLKGDFSFFSLNADKIITSVKGGGILFKDKKKYKQLIDDLMHNKKENLPPINYTLNDLNAALALSELKLIDKFIKKRQEIAEYYNHAIIHAVNKNNHSFIKLNEFFSFNYSYYPLIISKSIKQIKSIFFKHGVEVKELQEQTIFFYLKENEIKTLKNSAFLTKNILLIPLYPTLSPKKIQRIGDLLIASGK